MKLTKPTALKAALLMTLAANVSWEQIQFGSIELASNGSETVTSSEGAPTNKVSLPQAPISQSPPGVSVVKGPSVTQPAILEKPQALQYKATEPILICGDKFEFRLDEYVVENRKQTMVHVARIDSPSDAREAIGFPVRTDLIETLANKESAITSATIFIKQQRADKKLACGNETTKIANNKTAAPKTEEQIQLDEDFKNCKADAKGKRLESISVVKCWSIQLHSLKKRIETKDADGKRLPEKELARNALSEIQRISKIQKTELKKSLLSKDESRVEEAYEEIDDVMAAVDSAGSNFGGDEVRGYDNSISKIIAELSALKKASETRQAAEALKERGEEVKNHLRESRQNVMREPLDQQLNLEYINAKQAYANLNQDIIHTFENDELATLRRYKNSKLISAADFVDFVKPYTELQKILKDAATTSSSTTSSNQTFTGKITTSSLDSSKEVPADLAERRRTNSDKVTRIFGK